MNKLIKAHLAVLSANFIFGANYAIVKYITPGYLHPFALNAIRILVSLFLFWTLFLFTKKGSPILKADIPRFLLCALTGVVINQLLFIKGVSLTTPIHSSLLALGTPIFITVIAAWILKEGFTLLKFLGLVMGITGAGILILNKEIHPAGSNLILGDILVLINAISYAFYLVLVRPLMKNYSVFQVMRWVFTFGAIGILPFGIPELIHTSWQSFEWAQWMAIGFIAVGATFLAYLFNVYGINKLGASATGAYIYTQPVFAAIIAILFAGEKGSFIKLMAALFIFTGVFLVNFKKQLD